MRVIFAICAKRRSALPLLLLGAIALLAHGCGGDDGGASDVSVTTSGLTPEQYAKRADKVCQDGRETLFARSAGYEKQSGDADKELSPDAAYADFVQGGLLPYLRAELNRLRALGAPEGDEETVEAILTAQKESIDEVSGLEELSAEEGALESHFEEANSLMRDYGIEQCTAR